MSAERSRSWKVCERCQPLLVEKQLGSSVAGDDDLSGTYTAEDGLQVDIHHAYLSALEGCVVCARIWLMITKACREHKDYVRLRQHEPNLSEGDIRDRILYEDVLPDDIEPNDAAPVTELDDIAYGSLTWTTCPATVPSDALSLEPELRFYTQRRLLKDSEAIDTFVITLHAVTTSTEVCTEVYVTEWTDLDSLGDLSIRETSTGSQASLGLLKAWYNRCKTEHDICQHDAEPQWRPARLLKLSEDVATLVDCDQEISTAPYATLSHCWGKARMEILSSHTEKKLKAGTPISSFALTFQQAMIVTKMLGLQYLWIDCFCILQGQDQASADDWDHQSKQMDRIYGNGSINISACHALDPSVGLFTDRGMRAVDYVPFHSNTSATHRFKVFFERRVDLPVPIISQNPVYTRGWCVQERILSRRIAYFDDDGIRWACSSCARVSEDKPSDHILSLWPRENETLPGILAGSDLARAKIKDVYAFWLKVLADYTACSLTFPAKDKIRAVDGILRYVSTRLGDSLVVGHFVSKLLESLYWKTKYGATHGGRRVSSWSWASFDGPLEFLLCTGYADGSRMVSLAAIISIQSVVEYSGAVPKITMLGRLLPAQLLKQDAQLKLRATIGSQQWQVDGWFDSPADVEILVREQGTLHALPLFWLDRRKVSCCMLLLLRSSDGSFRRLGIADHYSLDPRNAYSDQEQKPQAWREVYMKTKASLLVVG